MGRKMTGIVATIAVARSCRGFVVYDLLFVSGSNLSLAKLEFSGLKIDLLIQNLICIDHVVGMKTLRLT